MEVPRRSPHLGLVLLLVVFAGAMGAIVYGFSRTTPTSSFFMRERRTFTLTRPNFDALTRELKRDMIPAEVEVLLGAPDTRSTAGPFETWSYSSGQRSEHRRYFLGVIPMGGGSGSTGSTVFLVFRDGKLAQAPHVGGLDRRAGGEYARLMGAVEHRRYKVQQGPSAGRPFHDQVCAIVPGTTTTREVEDLLGTPDEARERGSLAAWVWRLKWSDGSSASAWSPTVRFRDGMVVETPYLKEAHDDAMDFVDSESWPLRKAP